jgi:serine phosphatase RsbU (regulator of sigma subunit)
MEIQIAVSKTNKFASPESGDTLEIIERPQGGVSIVLADGKADNVSSKMVSNKVVHAAIKLLMEGIRDGAAARAASDALYTDYNGKAKAYLNILSADLQTHTFVIVRNSPAPILIAHHEKCEFIQCECSALGISRNIRPAISEIPMELNQTIVMYTDGIWHSGSEFNLPPLDEQPPSPQFIADTILSEAMRLDHGRPSDDMSVVVLRVINNITENIRRMTVRLPVEKSLFSPE